MLIEALRNIRRRRMRTFLTILGIAIGVIALTVMGSLAELKTVWSRYSSRTPVA